MHMCKGIYDYIGCQMSSKGIYIIYIYIMYIHLCTIAIYYSYIIIYYIEIIDIECGVWLN